MWPLNSADTIALIAAIAAIISAALAGLALRDSRRSADATEISAQAAKNANSLSERIAKRAGVIELHQAWRGVNRFKPEAPVYPDAINIVNALDLTASLWNHDVLEKVILFQSYWKTFKECYLVISNCDLVIPRDGRKISSMISPAVTLAYKQMEEMELKGVVQTRIT